MKKLSIKDYGLIGLSVVLVVSLYSGSVKDKENKELRAVSEYLKVN